MSDRYIRFLDDLFNRRRAGVVFGLERVREALERLGHPEEKPLVRVHIGGTNGKGSTATFVESMTRHAGLRTGLFTSPHLSRLSERFVIAGEPVSRDEILRAADELAAVGDEALTFFERVTLIALILFARASVEVAVLEVGLGGRLDATNAVPAEIAAVTGVAIDHREYLGDTLEAIAGEKAGIFKPGQRVVIGAAGESRAVPWLAEHARRAGVAALTLPETFPDLASEDWTLGLPGRHQLDNAACALAIMDHLDTQLDAQLGERGRATGDETTRRRGLAEARLPGRFETVARSPTIVIDGAHNPHAATTLADNLDGLPGPRVLLLAIARDKDHRATLAPLLARADAAVTTRCRGGRALSPDDLLAVVREVAPPDMPVHACADVASALERARILAGQGGSIVITGSLYLAGEARQILCGDPADEIMLSDPVGITP